MNVLAIDPGNEESAWCLYDSIAGIPRYFAKQPNDKVLQLTEGWLQHLGVGDCIPDVLAVEMIASYGMPVGAEVFETCVWIGRYVESWIANDDGDAPRRYPHQLVYRRDVKLHLCGQARAKDGNVRQALIDRYGGKDKAIGKKSAKGPLYGVKSDVWSALALAITWSDIHAKT
jgi:hypothetical protein